MPLGLGRKIRNNVIEATMIPRMMKNMSGLEKAGLFSGGGVGDSMVGWMQKPRSLQFFFWRGGDVVLQGVFAKMCCLFVVLLW